MAAESSRTLAVRASISWPGFLLDIDHAIALDRITGLFGPSGSGKTTLLRFIAGFEQGASGRLEFAGTC
jgi:molybdate transport system ATP-binding protein